MLVNEVNLPKKNMLPSLKLTAKAPENRPFSPKGKACLPTIHFQVFLLLVSGRVNIPIGSMYGTFAYIYHKNQPFMQVNIPYMDPMG